MDKAKTTASRQVAFVVPQFWFTEPECGSVRGHLGRKPSQEDLNATPAYLTHTCNVTLKRGSWIEFKDLSSLLLYEQATMTHKVRLLLPVLSVKCTMVTIGATQDPTFAHSVSVLRSIHILHLSNRNTMELLFYPTLPDFRNSSALFEGSQATPACPSSEGNM